MSYSWYSFAEAYGKNQLAWRKKEGDWQTLTFHDGLYDYAGINAFLQAHTGFVEPHAEKKERVSQLYFNVTPFLAVVLTAKDHELDLTDEGFASLVGFEKRILKDGTNFTGKMIPDITRGVDWIFFSLPYTRTTGERCGERCFVQLVHRGSPDQLPFQKRTASTRVQS